MNAPAMSPAATDGTGGRPLRYGLIGCGMMGQEHLRNIALLDGAIEIAGLCDPDAASLAAARVLAPNAEASTALEPLLGLPGLDALVVVSPNDLHLPQMEVIAAQRVLPLLVEKPLFTDAAELNRLRAFRDGYAAPVWVAMEYRYMPPIAALLAQCDAVTGGARMLTIREHRFPFLPKVGGWNRTNARTGGTLVEKCCHFFDLMRLVLRSEPVRIMASGGQDVNHKDDRLPDQPAADIWDNAYVIVDFASGARAMLELCMFAEGSRFQEEITVLGPAGKIEARVPGPGRFWPGDQPMPEAEIVLSPRAPKGPRTVPVPVDPALLSAGDHNGATFYQHQRFLDVIRNGTPPEVSFDDGARAVLMGLAAQRAAETGQAVTDGLAP